jgi:hypothetical protein
MNECILEFRRLPVTRNFHKCAKFFLSFYRVGEAGPVEC